MARPSSTSSKDKTSTTRRLAVINLALRGSEADFGPGRGYTSRRDLRADYVLANPPFNDSDWFRKDDDVSWQWGGATWTTRQGCPKDELGGVHQFGVPPKPARRDSANLITEGKPQVVSAARDNNANFAWVQHFIHHLAPHGSMALLLLS